MGRFWKEWMINVVEKIEKIVNSGVRKIEFEEEVNTVHLVVILNTDYLAGEEFIELVDYLNSLGVWGVSNVGGRIAVTLTKMKV